jgi:GTPase
LVEAFRSTLEEVGDADLIVHVVDASHPDPALQIHTVREVLSEVDAHEISELIVFNKADLIDHEKTLELRGLEPTAVFVSAKTGEGIDSLMEAIGQMLPRPSIRITATIPFDRGDLVALIHSHGEVLTTDYTEQGTVVEAMVDEKLEGQLAPYRSDQPKRSG